MNVTPMVCEVLEPVGLFDKPIVRQEEVVTYLRLLRMLVPCAKENVGFDRG